MTAQPDTAPRAKKSQWTPIETAEIVCWRGELAALLALLRISKPDFEKGLRGKLGVRRVELRNRAPVIAALQRKLSDAESE